MQTPSVQKFPEAAGDSPTRRRTFFQNGIITWKRACPTKSGFAARSNRPRLPPVETGLAPSPETQQAAPLRGICGRSANRNDVVGDDRTLAGDDHSQRNAFRFVVVAAMQEVHNSNSRAKTQR